MHKINTHYDNLKVARNAPPEVIRAAYKSLSHKYHPDRNLNNLDAIRIMTIINASYAVLSDPVKRKEHDLWIAEKESASTEQNITNQNTNFNQAKQVNKNSENFSSVNPNIFRHWILFGIVLAVILIYFVGNYQPPILIYKTYPTNGKSWADFAKTKEYQNLPVEEKKNAQQYYYENVIYPTISEMPDNEIKSTRDQFFKEANPTPIDKAFATSKSALDYMFAPSAAPKPYIAEPTPESKSVPPANVRPLNAPNGQPWPSVAGYVEGYKMLHTKGLSSITVDNTQNDSDVFVKVASLDGAEAYPIRQFYIPAHGKFTVTKVDAGSYDVRYRDLNSGSLSRSESFKLEENIINGGIQFSDYTMTLYKVRNGNMQTYGLSEAEF